MLDSIRSHLKGGFKRISAMATFGWSEYLSIFSLTVSIYAAYESYDANAPRILVSSIEPQSVIMCEPVQKFWATYYAVPIRLSNYGGRAVSIMKVTTEAQVLDLPLPPDNAGASSFKSLTTDDFDESKLYNGKQHEGMIELFAKRGLYRSLNSLSIEDYSVLFSTHLEPGQPKTIVIGFALPYGGPSPKLAVSVRVEMSEGHSVSFERTIEGLSSRWTSKRSCRPDEGGINISGGEPYPNS